MSRHKEFGRTRRRLGISIKECADIMRVGANGRTIRRWERGDVVIPPHAFTKLQEIENGELTIEDAIDDALGR